jgi:hypothetical protein
MVIKIIHIEGFKVKKMGYWGIFPESKEFSAVPTNWLFETIVNGRKTINC